MRQEMVLWAGGPHISTTYERLLPLAKDFRPDLASVGAAHRQMLDLPGVESVVAHLENVVAAYDR